MKMYLYSDAEPAQLEALQTRVAEHTTLERAVRCWLGQQPPIDITDVVTQDEFTHDVVVQLPEGLVLVYDAT